jgi:hypothetical protein
MQSIFIESIAELKLLQSEGVMKAPKLSSIVRFFGGAKYCMILIFQKLD